MGLNNRNSHITYIRCADGKFYLSSDKEKATAYDELSGTITDVRIREEEWEGQPIKKVNFTMKDGEDTYVVSLNLDSSYAASAINFLKNADLSKELTLAPRESEEKDKTGKEVKRRAILVSQDGKGVKAYYSKATKRTLPEWKQVTVNRKTVWDKTDFLNELERIAVEELAPIAKGNSVDQRQDEDSAPKTNQPEMSDEPAKDVKANDLPWD